MRKILSVVLVLSLVLSMTPMAFANDYQQGMLEGKAAAENHPSSAGLWGFSMGLLGGLIGGGLTVGVYALSNPDVPFEHRINLADKSQEYQLAFADAYKEQAKKNMVSKASLGAGAGILTAVILVSLAANSY